MKTLPCCTEQSKSKTEILITADSTATNEEILESV